MPKLIGYQCRNCQGMTNADDFCRFCFSHDLEKFELKEMDDGHFRYVPVDEDA